MIFENSEIKSEMHSRNLCQIALPNIWWLMLIDKSWHARHYVKNIRIRSFSGPFFSAFGLDTERYPVSLRIQPKCRKIRTRKTPNRDAFYAVRVVRLKTRDNWFGILFFQTLCRILGMMRSVCSSVIHSDQCSRHIETSQLIYKANLLTGSAWWKH